MAKFLTLEDVERMEASLYAKKSEYEEDYALAEWQYYMNEYSRVKKAIKAGKKMTMDDID